MTSIFKKAAIGAALAASALMVSSPAQARHRDYRHGNDGAAIAAGIIGLAAVAAIASSSNRNRYYHDDYYYYPRSYYPRYRVYRTYPRYYSYHYDTYPRPYRRHRYYRGW